VQLGELAARLGCELRGDGELEISGVAGLDEPALGDSASSPTRRHKLAATRAALWSWRPGQ
jgi:hypothetical protein